MHYTLRYCLKNEERRKLRSLFSRQFRLSTCVNLFHLTLSKQTSRLVCIPLSSTATAFKFKKLNPNFFIGMLSQSPLREIDYHNLWINLSLVKGFHCLYVIGCKVFMKANTTQNSNSVFGLEFHLCNVTV